MINHSTVIIKSGQDLDWQETAHINHAKSSEWKVPPIDDEQKKEMFFLIKGKNGEILAHGQLIRIDGVVFSNKQYVIMGIGGIISTIRGKGYGRILITAIKDYLVKNKKTGIGFTGIPAFYEKCGFQSDKNSLKQFVHVVGSKRIRNTSDEYLIYHDSVDQLMRKVLANPDKEVFLPRNPDW